MTHKTLVIVTVTIIIGEKKRGLTFSHFMQLFEYLEVFKPKFDAKSEIFEPKTRSFLCKIDEILNKHLKNVTITHCDQTCDLVHE